MSFIPAGWTAADVERELIDPPARAWAPFPGLELIDRPDWLQLTCIHFPTGGLNEIVRAKLTADEADAVIDRTLAHYAERKLSFRWSVVPGTTPADLPQRLERRGLVATEIVALTRSTAVELTSAPGVNVEFVDAGSVDLFSRVMAEGWGAPLGAMGDYNRACLDDPSGRHQLFLAYVDGEPAGTAAGLLFERSIYLLGGVVLPKFRRRGVHRALTQKRLRLAEQRGLPLATTRAIASTSAPLLLAQGWDEWFRFPSYALPLPAPAGRGSG